MPMRWYPQLAKPGDISVIDDPRYNLEEKLDGIRCLVYAGINNISINSRTGKPLDNAFPDLVESLQGLIDEAPAILDGEIVPSIPEYTFQNLQTRLQRITDVDKAIKMCPAKFVAFDMLESAGLNMINMPLNQRRNIMKAACRVYDIECSQLITPEEALEILETREGVMAKLRDSEYYPGTRHGSWLKIKKVKTLDAIVCGCTFGIGRRALEAGSLLLGEETFEGLKYIGNVGTGYTDAMLSDICKLIETFEMQDSPFLDWPATEADSALVKSYCKPGKIIVRVNYQERTRNGMLRFPSLKSIKVDSEA
jgi:bifunctional non-homologous end joining protein LigD